MQRYMGLCYGTTRETETTTYVVASRPPNPDRNLVSDVTYCSHFTKPPIFSSVYDKDVKRGTSADSG